MSAQDNCPKCESVNLRLIDRNARQFNCGSVSRNGTVVIQTAICTAKERDQLAAEIQTLRTANAALVERVSRLEEARTLAAANSLANMLTHDDALTKIQALIREGNKLEAIVRRDYGGAYCDEWTKAKGQP